VKTQQKTTKQTKTTKTSVRRKARKSFTNRAQKEMEKINRKLQNNKIGREQKTVAVA